MVITFCLFVLLLTRRGKLLQTYGFGGKKKHSLLFVCVQETRIIRLLPLFDEIV